MIFIVDTNIVFSGLLKDSIAREILIAAPFIFLAPDAMLSEIRKYEELILQRTGLAKDEFETLFSIITENITVVGKEKYAEKLSEAEQLLGKDVPGDFPFLALALSVLNKGIWTEDRHFERQNRVQVWKTSDVIKEINKSQAV